MLVSLLSTPKAENTMFGHSHNPGSQTLQLVQTMMSRKYDAYHAGENFCISSTSQSR